VTAFIITLYVIAGHVEYDDIFEDLSNVEERGKTTECSINAEECLIFLEECWIAARLWRSISKQCMPPNLFSREIDIPRATHAVQTG
jgi:hypothetical protein